MKKTYTAFLTSIIILLFLSTAFLQGCKDRPKVVRDVSALWDMSEDVGDIDAGKTAKEAYFILEENVFNTRKIREGVRMMMDAAAADKNEPWVYLTASQAILIYGYKIGDRLKMKTYRDGTVEQAIAFSEKALDLGPDISEAHAHLGRLFIIKRKYQAALEHLDKAQELDRESFYPRYYKGALFKERREFDKALSYFEEAEARVEFDYHHSFINGHRQDVAELTGNYLEQERLLKENIERRPDYPYYYSHYAYFLKGQGRLDEAIMQWEKAVELGPYPNAVRQLENARKQKARQR